MDRPDSHRKFHARATPRTGGIPLLLSYVGAYGLLFLLPLEGAGFISGNFEMIGRLLPPVALLFLTGLVDDWLTLKPWQKLAGQVAASMWAWQAGVRIAGVGGFETPAWISFGLTVAWLVLCTNAFNLIDGVDGLAAGVGLTATLTVFLAGILHGDVSLGMATAPLAGCLLGFLRYNFNPASIFLGDSGSLLIGFLLGSYGVIWSQKSATVLGVAGPVMALALPLLEVGLSIVRRFLRSEPIFSADRGHIHHLLLDRGFTPRRVSLVLYAACGIGAALALIQNVPQRNYGAISILLFATATWIGIRYLGYAEFAATSRFLWAGLRPMLSAHVKLELLERSLGTAGNVEECWSAIERAARSLGYSEMTARIGEQRFSIQPAGGHASSYWQMRLNLSAECWVNISQHDASERPLLVIPFAEIVRRVLPEKVRQFDAQKIQAAWLNSRTSTVMSSDCTAPSVNAATAS